VASFKDANGNEWLIEIDPVNIDQVNSELGVSLYTILDNGMQPLKELLDNRPVFLNLVYILVRDQVQAKQLTDRDFLKGLKGDAMEAMCEAFYIALADFHPKKKRELLMQLMDESNRLMAELFTKGSGKAMTMLRNKFGELSASLDLIPDA
jgi:hypothetical protein